MSSLKAAVARSACAAFRMTRNFRDRNRFRALMYHSIGSDVIDDVQHRYNISPDSFRRQMELLDRGFRGRMARLGDLDTRENGIAITFDDGYRNTLEVAAPLLAGLKIPFTVFVAPGLVLSGDPLYLSPTALRELSSCPGVTIGAHGYSHRPLTGCDDATLAYELTQSRAWLEDLLGNAVTCLSYPHGAMDTRVRRAVSEAGYRLAACSRFGTYSRGMELLAVPRTDVWAQDDETSFYAKLAGDWDWLGWRR